LIQSFVGNLLPLVGKLPFVAFHAPLIGSVQSGEDGAGKMVPVLAYCPN